MRYINITFAIHKPSSVRYPKKRLEQILAACRRYRIGSGITIELSLVWVGEARMRELNKQYRGKDMLTNVLTFPYKDDDTKYEAEIVLCKGVIAKDVKKRTVTLEEETTHLIIHGILHVLGYEHRSQRGKKAMEAVEQKILEEIYKKKFSSLH